MPYTPQKPPPPYSAEELAARIPGWGVDRDPKDRPSVPRERLIDPSENGAHWEFPERQPERWPRERSVEHKFLTPVFGTACPPKGLSGVLRRYAYQFSEGRAAHWLILMAADRVDAAENQITALLAGRPDNPISESGILSEVWHNGFEARGANGRADRLHHVLDPMLIAGPWVVAAGAAYKGVRGLARVVTGRRGRRSSPAGCASR